MIFTLISINYVKHWHYIIFNFYYAKLNKFVIITKGADTYEWRRNRQMWRLIRSVEKGNISNKRKKYTKGVAILDNGTSGEYTRISTKYQKLIERRLNKKVWKGFKESEYKEWE